MKDEEPALEDLTPAHHDADKRPHEDEDQMPPSSTKTPTTQSNESSYSTNKYVLIQTLFQFSRFCSNSQPLKGNPPFSFFYRNLFKNWLEKSKAQFSLSFGLVASLRSAILSNINLIITRTRNEDSAFQKIRF